VFPKKKSLVLVVYLKKEKNNFFFDQITYRKFLENLPVLVVESYAAERKNPGIEKNKNKNKDLQLRR
tara:strand:+ start:52 stop:252 length:201 start_codon:yes stop_codon:yes gene_type:complete